MTGKDLLFLVALVLAGSASLLCYWLEGRLRQARRRELLAEAGRKDYRQRLLALREQMAVPPPRPAVAESVASEPKVGDSVFSEELQGAGLRLRLQSGEQQTPGMVERYRLAGNMVQRGLSVDDISAILEISNSETEELLKLSQLAPPAD